MRDHTTTEKKRRKRRDTECRQLSRPRGGELLLGLDCSFAHEPFIAPLSICRPNHGTKLLYRRWFSGLRLEASNGSKLLYSRLEMQRGENLTDRKGPWMTDGWILADGAIPFERVLIASTIGQ